MDENGPQEYAFYPRNSAADPREYYGPPDFRIGALNEAWTILKADMVTWIVGSFLVGIIAYAVYMPAQFYSTFRLMSDDKSSMPVDVLVVDFLSSLASGVVGGIVTGGYYRIILERMRLSYEGIGGMFDLRGQGIKLALWGGLMGIPGSIVGVIYTAMAPLPQENAKTVDFAALFGPMFAYFGVLVVLALLVFPFFLTPLIIVDQKVSIMEAAAKSWKTVTRSYFKALGFFIVASLVAFSGIVACGVGMFLTVPLLYLMVAIAYRDHFMPPLSPSPQEVYSQ